MIAIASLILFHSLFFFFSPFLLVLVFVQLFLQSTVPPCHETAAHNKRLIRFQCMRLTTFRRLSLCTPEYVNIFIYFNSYYFFIWGVGWVDLKVRLQLKTR